MTTVYCKTDKTAAEKIANLKRIVHILNRKGRSYNFFSIKFDIMIYEINLTVIFKLS
jgi:hypothetical protein